MIAGFLGLLVVYYSGVSCNMQSCSFTPCYPLSFIVALLGVASLYILAYTIRKNKFLSWLGMNSLVIMLVHEPVKRIVIKFYSVIVGIPVDALRDSVAQSLVMTLLTILAVIPIVIFINKYALILLGRFKANS